MPEVSIIIPCYNQGQWLEEAVTSALAQDHGDFEVILINDGSTDPVTRRIFDAIEHPLVRKKTTPNQGLAAARNEGVALAAGRYILPLDSDDRIDPTYARKAAAVLNTRSDVGIVYCLAEFFGEESGLWELEDFEFPGILTSPRIFATAMYRRADWEKVGGYRPDMIYGWEDYDFWLSLIATGVRVHRLDEVLFFYRRTQGSMAGLDRTKALYSYRKLFEHHRDLYADNIGVLFESVIDAKPVRDQRRPRAKFEVFIPDREEAYAGRNTREQFYPVGVWARVAILLDGVPDAGIHLLRVDPTDRVAVVDVASIRMLDPANGAVLWDIRTAPGGFDGLVLGHGTLRLPEADGLRLFCSHTDGLFFLPKVDQRVLDRPLILEVWVRQHANLDPVTAVLGRQYEADRAEREHAQLVEARARLEGDVQTLQGEIVKLRDHAHQLEQVAMSARTEAGRVQAEFHNLQASLKLTEAEKVRIQGIVEARDAEVSGLNKDIQSLNEQLRGEQENRARLERRLAQVERSPLRRWTSFLRKE